MPWQPPFSYALVTRELPLEFADRLMANFVCLGLTKLSRSLFVRRQNSDVGMRLSVGEKEEEITERVGAISALVASMQGQFQKRERMIAQLFPEAESVVKSSIRAEEQDAECAPCEHAFASLHGLTCPYCVEPFFLERCTCCDDAREILPGVPCPLCTDRKHV